MKPIGVVFIVFLLAAILLYWQRSTLLTYVSEQGIQTQLSTNMLDDLQDGLHLALCGAGGPLPAPNASGPCVAVVAGQQLFLVDAGTDGIRNLARLGYPLGRIAGVFLTHFHSDHIDGLGEVATLRWASVGNTSALPLYGPTGVMEIAEGINRTYRQDSRYRQQHHGDLVAPLSGTGLMPKEFETPADDELVVVYQQDGVTVEALAVDHAPVVPAVAYRFSYAGRTLLISGDTAYSKNLEKFAQGVDLLVHEALAPNMVKMVNQAAVNVGNQVLAKVTIDILDYHTTPAQAAQIARDAQVGHLLYYHIIPPIIASGQQALFLDGAEDIFANYTVGQDGTSFSLPANSKDIVLTRKEL